MKRLSIYFLIVLSLLIVLPQQTFAQDRFAECDLCGYCKTARTGTTGGPTPVQVPGNWEECRTCYYPKASKDAKSNSSLKIINDQQVTPYPGRYFTQLGCVSTNMQDFSTQGAAGNVVTFLLGVIFRLVGGVAFLYLIYGAYVIITGKGDPSRLNEGRSIVMGAIFGLIFTLLVTLILNLIGGGILRIPGFGG